MRTFRIECITLGKEPAETVWDTITDRAQTVLISYAPHVPWPGTWKYHHDDWHHWTLDFHEVEWVNTGTLVFAASVTLMLKDDPELADFAVVLYYRDDAGDWVECG